MNMRQKTAAAARLAGCLPALVLALCCGLDLCGHADVPAGYPIAAVVAVAAVDGETEARFATSLDSHPDERDEAVLSGGGVKRLPFALTAAPDHDFRRGGFQSAVRCFVSLRRLPVPTGYGVAMRC